MLLTVLATRGRARATTPSELATIARQATFVGEKLFAPAGGVVFAMGIAMVINDHTAASASSGSTSGLVGYAITFVTGIAVLSPRAKKIVALFETQGPTRPGDAGRDPADPARSRASTSPCCSSSSSTWS